MKQRLRRPLAMLLTVVMLLGLLPAAAFAAGGEGGETKLTTLTLTQSDGTQVANLLDSTGTDPMTLDGFTAYTLNIGAELNMDSEAAKTLTIKLPNGMQFVNMDEDALKENNSAIEDVSWAKGESIYEGVYRPNNGTVTITFSSGAAAANFGLSVQPDMAFFPVEKKESGMKVQDAISVTLAEGETQKSTVNKDVLVTTTRHLSDLNIVNVELPKQNVAADSEVDLGTANVLVGFFSSGQTQTKRLNNEVKVTLSVPDEITFKYSTLGEPKIESGQDGNATWTFTVANQYTTSRSLQLVVEIPGNASLNKSYEIKILEISTKGYGQTNPHTKTFDNSTIWTLTVVDPSDVLLGVTPLPATNVYNFTKNGNDSHSFSDYNTLLASAKITNDGVAAIAEDLIYEAVFDQTIQFVTAVGIPCDWSDSDTDNVGLPTQITVTDSNNKEYVLDSADEIRKAARLPYAGYGFILRAEDIPGFPKGVSIQSVKVELPGLPEDYQSTGQFPVFEGNNLSNAYAGVWGRIKPGTGANATGENQFRIYEEGEDASEDSWTTATTTVRDTSKITGEDYLTNQLTVGGKAVSTVSSGDTLHVKQEIKPSNYHEGDGRPNETILLNPVIYVVEPVGMTIANETFSTDDGTTVLAYKREDITNQVSTDDNWPEGYNLYQYTFNDTLLLGWWDGDWSSTALTMEFDYQISRTAKPATYNVWDLIFYKSALNMEFTRNSKEDTYGLNGNNPMGRVNSKTFTVNTRNVFEIVSQIQMEGQGDHWYEYNPDNPGATTAVFTSGATAKVKINIMNNTAGDAEDVVVYIPVPKEGLDLGDAFGLTGTDQFDMYAAGVDGGRPDGWTVEYGTATGTFEGSDADDLTLQTDTTWENTPSNAHNIIKLTLSEDATLEPGETAEIILKFTATDDTGQTNRTNFFKSWYQYTAGSDSSSATMVTPKDAENNFACRLQNGKLSGTIYIDSNGNGQMDTGESGLDGVTVEITTGTSGQSTQTTTADGGKYSFNSLPSNEEITVTIINPGSPNASAANPYRFSTYVKSEETTIGTDVTATEDGQQATATLKTLGDSGAAVVNAGLTVPVTVTLSAEGHGTVNPSSVKVFAGDTIADGLGNNEAITVTANTGWKFAGTWLKGEDTENTILDSDLKSQKVSGPVTYTAQFVAVPVGTITGNTKITLHTPTTDNPNSTTLTVSLSNQSDLTGEITYQWQKLNGTTWENVAGGTSTSLTLTGLEITDNGAKYQCVVTSGGNSATIGPVTLTVQKGSQPMPTVSHTDPSTIGGTGSIGTGESGKLTTAMEYNTDNGGKWTKVDETTADNGITGIPAGTTYYIRYAETKYLNASDEQIITIDEPNTYTITVAGLEHGSITTDPSGSTTANTEVTLTITPAQGYQLKEGSLKVTYQDDEQTVAVTDNKFTMPAADVTVSAEFEAIQYTITYVLNDGINNASNPDHYTVEQNISLTAPTKDGYTFTGWTWDGQTTPQQNVNISAGDITGNLTFTAHWEYEDIPTPPTEHTVTVKGSHAATTGAGSYAEGASVTIQAGTREGYTFAGWTVTPESVTLNNADSATTTFTMPGEDVTVTATWTKDEEPGPTPAGAITVTPADIIIYMGGKDGYEGTVNQDGNIVGSQSLPEPGFVFDLPPELETALDATGEDITDVKFQNEDGTKTWIVQLYQGLDKSATRKLYTIVPTYEDHDPVRVVFTDGDKHIVSDEFTVGLEINKDFGMSLYTGLAGEIKAVYDGKEYPVELGEGILTVLGTTEEVSITTVTETAPTNGQAGAVATAGTTYTINNSEVAVTGGDVSLLFDNIINHTGNDRTSKLEERASEWLAEEGIVPTAQHQFVYELKYLDLVDANNGNAWVTASDDLTIYWPLPAGADADSLKVLHFKDLHRDMDTGEIEDEIADCEVESLTFQIDGNYITFEVGQGGFSPFALVWEEAIPENTFIINATAGSGGSISPSGAVQVTAGGSQTFAITPSGGYHIEDVLVDGVSVGAVRSYTFSDVQGNHTIQAVFDSDGGGSVTTPRYIIEAEAGQGGEISPDGRVRVARGSDKTFTITPDKGYRIADVLVDGRSIGVVSRYTFENVRSNHTIKVFFEKYSSVADPDDTGVSEWLDTSDHRDFLHGYTDGTFGPNRNMTRGEVAQMFYNLLLEQEVPQTTVFTDVPADMWCADAVNTLASLGIVEGIGKGLYAPDRAITRAEFTVIAMRFAKLDTSGENIFSDVDTGDWFYEQVVGSIKYGWIQGYADGTFRPDNTITRAEVTTITNRMLGRAADEAFVDRHSDELRQFPDVPESYWAYYNIMEATNAHDFGMENGTEDWTGLN